MVAAGILWAFAACRGLKRHDLIGMSRATLGSAADSGAIHFDLLQGERV
jgi:hypothetical protein